MNCPTCGGKFDEHQGVPFENAGGDVKGLQCPFCRSGVRQNLKCRECGKPFVFTAGDRNQRGVYCSWQCDRGREKPLTCIQATDLAAAGKQTWKVGRR